MSNKKSGDTYNQQTEIPSLYLCKSKQRLDFEIEKIEIHVKGINIRECRKGFDYMLDVVKRLGSYRH
tara:strand:+ start:221 stop:421 length:201 start_codon:yes stop_codon:yes gene_type:complete